MALGPAPGRQAADRRLDAGGELPQPVRVAQDDVGEPDLHLRLVGHGLERRADRDVAAAAGAQSVALSAYGDTIEADTEKVTFKRGDKVFTATLTADK